jgi:hypothetical protein
MRTSAPWCHWVESLPSFSREAQSFSRLRSGHRSGSPSSSWTTATGPRCTETPSGTAVLPVVRARPATGGHRQYEAKIEMWMRLPDVTSEALALAARVSRAAAFAFLRGRHADQRPRHRGRGAHYHVGAFDAFSREWGPGVSVCMWERAEALGRGYDASHPGEGRCRWIFTSRQAWTAESASGSLTSNGGAWRTRPRRDDALGPNRDVRRSPLHRRALPCGPSVRFGW